MKQYCRYCAFCFEGGDEDFRCSNHPNGEQPHWTRKQINRQNHCPNFILSDLGDVETEKPYRPISKRAIKKNDGQQMKMDVQGGGDDEWVTVKTQVSPSLTGQGKSSRRRTNHTSG